MTDKKKLKRRVRSRMAETGKRYTEVLAEPRTFSIKEVVREILSLWRAEDLGAIFHLIEAFDRGLPDASEARPWSTVAMVVLKLLKTNRGAIQHDPRILADVLVQHMDGHDTQFPDHLPEAEHRAGLSRRVRMNYERTSAPEEDDAYFKDVERDWDDSDLQGIWNSAPDVSAAFGAESSPRRSLAPGSWFRGEAFFHQRARVREQNALLQDSLNDNRRLREALLARGVNPDEV